MLIHVHNAFVVDRLKVAIPLPAWLDVTFGSTVAIDNTNLAK